MKSEQNYWTIANETLLCEVSVNEMGAVIHRVYDKSTNALVWETIGDICQWNGDVESGNKNLDIKYGHDSESIYITKTNTEDSMHQTVMISVDQTQPIVHIRVQVHFTRSIMLNKLHSLYRFLGSELDFSYVPNVRPKENQVIGQHVFRSPAVIFQQKTVCGALIPDLAEIERLFQDGNPTMPHCIHVEADPQTVLFPEVGYGFQLHRSEGHVYYRHDPNEKVEIAAGTSLSYGFHLFTDTRAPAREGYRSVVHWMWRQYSAKYLKSLLPQTVTLEKYAEYGMDYALSELWMNGRIGDKKIGYVIMNRELPLDVHFQAWFNHIRTAYGMKLLGSYSENEDWQSRGEAIKRLLLAAPQSASDDQRETCPLKIDSAVSMRHTSNEGAFPTVFYQQLVNATKYPAWRASTRQGGGDSHFHTTDMSWAAYWLLRWHKDIQAEEAVIRFCRNYGEYLLRIQLPSGAIPSWLHVTEGTPSEVLKESAQSSVSGLFLALLADLTGESAYLQASRKIATFLENEIISENRWTDFEVFFSCSRKPLDFYDSHTRQYGQNNLVIHWTAELFKHLYIATGEDRFLKKGTAVLDYLSLFQQIWDAPFLSVYTFGGFGVQNSDAEWNDARQGVFTETYGDYYALTGNEEYLQRAVYAARASFLTMNIPENHAIYPYWQKYAIGHSPENYAHDGDLPAGASGFDWQVGSGLTGWIILREKYGDLYIDFDRKHAVGINGCVVVSRLFVLGKVELEVNMLESFERTPTIKVRIGHGVTPVIIINGKELCQDWLTNIEFTTFAK